MALKVLYFKELPYARDFAIRLALGVADAEYTYEQFSIVEDWPKIKADKVYDLPYTPVVTLPGNKICQETHATLLYVGEKYGLLPSDPYQKALSFELQLAVDEVHLASRSSYLITDPEKAKEARQKLSEEMVAPRLAAIEKILEKNGRTGHAVGDGLSTADCMLAWIYVLFYKILGGFPKEPLEKCPKFVACCEAVLERPGVKKLMDGLPSAFWVSSS